MELNQETKTITTVLVMFIILGLADITRGMYSPKTGRFLQVDPIGYGGGLNLYTYCGNNPINWIDPFGLIKRLGIHSTGGHSWITVHDTDTDVTTSYGLWHDKYKGERLRPDSDVRVNKEPHSSKDSRMQDLSDEQANRLDKFLNKDHEYRWWTNNCSSWASDAWRKATGEDLNADTWNPWWHIGGERPWTLMDSIREANKKKK